MQPGDEALWKREGKDIPFRVVVAGERYTVVQDDSSIPCRLVAVGQRYAVIQVQDNEGHWQTKLARLEHLFEKSLSGETGEGHETP